MTLTYSGSSLLTSWAALEDLQALIDQNLSKAEARRRQDWRDSVRILEPHPKQLEFINSPAKRKVIRAGRRGGKTTGIAILAQRAFLAGRRVLYATPTQEQITRFWAECKRAFEVPLDAKLLYKNETEHIIELPRTETRIRAKTAWDADSLRGDYADLLILDEYQLMNEDAWERVGAPMLLDNNGDAVFIYTPPSLHSAFRTKARDSQHAAKLFKRAKDDQSERWEAFHFASHDNPHISTEALEEITQDMTALAYDQEILALDKDEAPGALWTRQILDTNRVRQMPNLTRLIIGVDPPGGATECGIVIAGLGADGHGYVLDDQSLRGSPETWSKVVVDNYHDWEADRIVAEINFGGDMVKHTLKTAQNAEENMFKLVRASRGKAVRAEPIAALYERGKVHHVGRFTALEDELCMWLPNTGLPSPNRLDAMVWALSELMLKQVKSARSYQG